MLILLFHLQENGVREAIRGIYTYLERARKDRTTL